MKILLVTGSREISDYRFVFKSLDDIKKDYSFDSLLTGGAEGVDFLVKLYALYHKIPYEQIKPDWKQFGKGAGAIRNAEMVDICDKGTAIWDGFSRGTQHCIYELDRANKLLRVFHY